MRSANPRMIPARGVPVPQSRAVNAPASTPAISGASAVFRGFRRRRSRRRRRAIAAASASSRRYVRKCSGCAVIQESGSLGRLKRSIGIFACLGGKASLGTRFCWVADRTSFHLRRKPVLLCSAAGWHSGQTEAHVVVPAHPAWTRSGTPTARAAGRCTSPRLGTPGAGPGQARADRDPRPATVRTSSSKSQS